MRPGLACCIFALLTACAGPGWSTSSTSAPTSAANASLPKDGNEGWPAGLVGVSDGDTLVVSGPRGEEEVRLLGINAPERGECFSVAAGEAAAALVGPASLFVEAAGGRDQFGRLPAYVYAGESLVNLGLLEGGFALAVHTDHPRLQEFLEAEERAYSMGAGLWAADACGTPVAALVAVAAVQADPPGPDQFDLNGEWVMLANHGEAVVDLSGWGLRDESSQHRYSFPAGALLRPEKAVTVHTGCGRDIPEDLYWCAAGPVWNNAGDSVLLLGPEGAVVARHRYP